MAAVSGRSLVTVTAALCMVGAGAQFGGGGGGFGYTPPAPICPAFSCPKGEKAVGKPDTQIVSYGCKDGGMNIMSMGKDFDPNNPYAGMNQVGKNLNKCCLERDICKQTCGMSSKDCHDAFQKCQTKVCKGDQSCQLQAMVADISNDPFENKDEDEKGNMYDPAKMKCGGYNNAQKSACQCVPKDEVTAANEKKLKAFYSKFNPEKLDGDGEIKDVEEVWKKWKGKEPAMFMALATKYKEKAVQIKEKPKYQPPPPGEGGSGKMSFDHKEGVESQEPSAEPTPEPAADAEGEAFEKELEELVAKKENAKKEEDFDLAEELKEKAVELKANEVKRLKAVKAKALEDEDYIQAKKIKKQIEKLEL